MNQESQSSNKRIAKNTILLYIRMIAIMFVSIFTSRITLESLGVEEYGIYNVVGGFIGIFALFRAGFVTTTQRFITYDLGRGDLKELNSTYNTCTIIFVAISLLILLIAETFGIWFLYNKLIIPPERLNAAFWVFQFSLASLIVGLLSVTQNALIIAHEKMKAFAYISIYEVMAKLAIAYALFNAPFDKLVFYAAMICFVDVSIRVIYAVYCTKHFKESAFALVFNKDKFKSIFKFTGWTMLGGIGVIVKNQGVNIVLNLFFGPAVNAARGLATQVQGAVQGFVLNFQMALNPQIVKTYSAGELSATYKLVYRSSKFSYCLLYLFALPLMLEADVVLGIWLKEVPDYTSLFIRMMFVIALAETLTNPIVRSIEASGKVMSDQLLAGGADIAAVGLSYVILQIDTNPAVVYILLLVESVLLLFTRLMIANRKAGIPVLTFIKEVIIRILLLNVFTATPLIILCHYMDDGLVRFFLIVPTAAILVILCSWFSVLSVSERNAIMNKVKTVLCKPRK